MTLQSDNQCSDRVVVTVIEDELTGLGNRRALTLALYDLDDPGADFAIGLIDLDGFSEINARYGHEIGDRVLSTVAEHVARAVPDDAAVFRPEGDEFVIILPRVADREELDDLAETINSAIREPIDLRDGPYELTASIGWATTPTASPEHALTQADAAMARAKRAGGAQTHTHSSFDALW